MEIGLGGLLSFAKTAYIENLAEQRKVNIYVNAFGGGCDDVRLNGNHFRIDCEYPSRIIRIWNDRTSFSISHDLSSIDFVEELT